jgi:hypothetical protein
MIVLVLKRLELRVTLRAVVLGLNLVEGLPALIQHAQAHYLLVTRCHAPLQLLQAGLQVFNGKLGV